MLDVAVGDEAVHDGVDAEARDGFDAELGGDVLAMGQDGVDADREAVGYLFVDVAGGEKPQHVGFAWRKCAGGLGGPRGFGDECHEPLDDEVFRGRWVDAGEIG